MKRMLVVSLVAVGIVGLLLILPHFGAASKPAAEKQLYTCGMHPQIIQDHPGDCPICNMKLEPVRKQQSWEQSSGENNATITVDPSRRWACGSGR